MIRRLRSWGIDAESSRLPLAASAVLLKASAVLLKRPERILTCPAFSWTESRGPFLRSLFFWTGTQPGCEGRGIAKSRHVDPNRFQ